MIRAGSVGCFYKQLTKISSKDLSSRWHIAPCAFCRVLQNDNMHRLNIRKHYRGFVKSLERLQKSYILHWPFPHNWCWQKLSHTALTIPECFLRIRRSSAMMSKQFPFWPFLVGGFKQIRFFFLWLCGCWNTVHSLPLSLPPSPLLPSDPPPPPPPFSWSPAVFWRFCCSLSASVSLSQGPGQLN